MKKNWWGGTEVTYPSYCDADGNKEHSNDEKASMQFSNYLANTIQPHTITLFFQKNWAKLNDSSILHYNWYNFWKKIFTQLE